MANLVEVIYKRVIRPYQYTILLVVMIILFTIGGYYSYQYYFKDLEKPSSDVANANKRNESVYVYLFHVDWCPHCKRAMPEWSSFKQQYDGKQVGGYEVKCIDVDCTEEDSEVANYINKYDIDSYPTVKMQKGVQTVSFDASVTSENLESFVEMMLN